MYLPRIKIQENFSEQYTLEIISHLMAVNAIMTSKTQIRWDLHVVKVEEERVEIRLLLLDQILLEANNPLIKEVASLTKVFSRMYSELHLVIDHKGTILEVLNMPAILNKWQQTKAELSEIANANPEIKNIILLNDSIFLNKTNFMGYIQKSEFFLMYFNSFFASRLPYDTANFVMPNFLNTANLNWDKTVTPVSLQNDIAYLELVSKPAFLQNDFNERAYSQFKDKLDMKKIKPALSETGNYVINVKNGKVLEAILKREEIADKEELFSKMEYRFTSDTWLKEMKNVDKKNNVQMA